MSSHGNCRKGGSLTQNEAAPVRALTPSLRMEKSSRLSQSHVTDVTSAREMVKMLSLASISGLGGRDSERGLKPLWLLLFCSVQS